MLTTRRQNAGCNTPNVIETKRYKSVPNANIIARCGTLPGAAQGASSTSELQFAGADSAQANVRVSPGYLANRQFVLKAGGHATGGTTTNLTVKLYLGKSATIGSNTLIFTSGAVAINSVSGNWELEAILIADVTSLKIQGVAYGALNNTAVAQAAIAAVTTTNPNTTEQAFTVTLQFSVSHANNAAICDYFEVEGA